MDKPKGPEAIAKAAMADIEAKKAAALAKGTEPDKKPATEEPAAEPSTAEKKPLEKESKSALEKAEEQAASDKTILETPEDRLTDDQKARKVELAKISEKTEKPKSNAEKRIDELVGKVKALEAQAGQSAEKDKKIAAMETELKDLREKVSKPAETKKQEDELSKREKERTAKYLDEDADLPREERREMSKEELEDWFIEDPTSAQEWITTKVLRRDKERREDEASWANKNKASDIIKAQGISSEKVIAKHPDLNVKERFAALKAEGKTPEEAQVIVQKENPTGYEKAKIIAAIIKEDEDKYLLSANGPELLMEEMERRLALKGKKPVVKEHAETDGERDARIAEEAAEAERQRQDGIDEPLNTNHRKPAPSKESPEYKKGLALYLKAFPKKTKADYDKRLETRSAIPGAT